MNLQSWAQLSEDVHQTKAFRDIVRFCGQFNLSASDYSDLAHVLIAVAIQSMDYDEPADKIRTFGADPRRARKIRLLHFIDDTLEFSRRRSALVHENDAYLLQRRAGYLAARNDMRLLHRFEDQPKVPSQSTDNFMAMFTNFHRNQLFKSRPRLSLARAFVDVAYVLAALCPRDEYETFCNTINAALEPPKDTEIRKLRVQHASDSADDILARALRGMPSASASIH